MVNNSSESNTVNYTIYFAENSTAIGALLLMLNNNNDGSFSNELLCILQDHKTVSTTNQLVNISNGVYRALAYDIESDGMIKSREPAVSAMAEVTGNLGKIVLVLL